MADHDSPHTVALNNEVKISKSLDKIAPENRMAFMQKYLITNGPDTSKAQTEPSSLDQPVSSSQRLLNLGSQMNPISDAAASDIVPKDPAILTQNSGTNNPLSNLIPSNDTNVPPLTPNQLAGGLKKVSDYTPVDTTNVVDDGKTSTIDNSKDSYETGLDASQQKTADAAKADMAKYGSGADLAKSVPPLDFNSPNSINSIADLQHSDDTNRIPASDTSTPQSDGLNAFQQAAKQARQDYGQAMQSDQDRLLMGGILKSSQMMGKAMGQTPGSADTSYADQILGQHNLATNALKTSQDYQGEVANQAQEQAMRDPDSAPSKAAQDLFEKTTGHSGKGLPAIVIMKLLPEAAAAIYKQSQITNMQGSLKVKQDNSDINQQKADTGDRRADTAQEKATALAKTSGDKSIQAYAKDRDVMLAPRGSPLGMEVRKVTQATHSLDFLSNIKSPDDFDKATPLQKQELAYTFATLLSPTGTPDVRTVQHMNEQGVGDMLASYYQKATGRRAPTNTGDLTKQLMEAVQKQQQVSINFVNNHQDTVDNKYASQIQANPKAYQDIYDSTNMAPRGDSKYFKSTQQAPTSSSVPLANTPTTGGQDPKVLQYMQMHPNVTSYSQAAGILKSRGYNAK